MLQMCEISKWFQTKFKWIMDTIHQGKVSGEYRRYGHQELQCLLPRSQRRHLHHFWWWYPGTSWHFLLFWPAVLYTLPSEITRFFFLTQRYKMVLWSGTLLADAALSLGIKYWWEIIRCWFLKKVLNPRVVLWKSCRIWSRHRWMTL